MGMLLNLLVGVLAIPPVHRVVEGRLFLEGVAADNPVIYDNDFWTDIPDAAYALARASLGELELRGLVITRCTFGWERGYVHTLEQSEAECRRLLDAARRSGLRGIPDPVIGAREALRRPASGRVEDTAFEPSEGSRLIVAEARRARPDKPLLVFVGGSCTTVATAYLSDPSIADRVIVFQVDGGGYNGSDGWAWQIAQTRLRFANWARGYFWPDLAKWDPAAFDRLPDNPLGRLLKDYAQGGLAQANQWGDGAWLFWLADPKCLTRAEKWDDSAITIPRDAGDVRAMSEAFFRTMTDPRVYGAP
jgi:hypothetical protein